jgi:hypothetical protein
VAAPTRTSGEGAGSEPGHRVARAMGLTPGKQVGPCWVTGLHERWG